ncbi:MAG: CPBP family intramembrane metalloprotease [Armatimonadetes bacterium]|nr:CPBP family intramembrane metalloprotease [Armatimonadota bacterium]
MTEENPSVIKTVHGPSSPTREYLITFMVGAFVFAFTWMNQYVWRNPTYENYIVVSIGLLFFIPLLSILLLMRSSPETFGLAAGNARLSWRYGIGMVMIMLPFLFIISRTSSAMDYYPLFRPKRYTPMFPLSWGYVIYFELLYGMYLLAWEWFFRGFLLFGLARGMGSWALIAQAIPFWLLHWGKPWPEFMGALVAGLALGFVALRTGSFLTGFLVHWVIAILFDLLVMLALSSQGVRLF